MCTCENCGLKMTFLMLPGAVLKLPGENCGIKIMFLMLGCVGHLTLPEKKWAPVAVKIFYCSMPCDWAMWPSCTMTGKGIDKVC